MANQLETSKRDSMADKEVNIDDAGESVTEDIESASHEDIVSSSRKRVNAAVR